MRILSWNVNGLRAVAGKGFTDWLNADAPDIICLQETKARPDQLKKEIREVPLPVSAGLNGSSGVAGVYTEQYKTPATSPAASGVAGVYTEQYKTPTSSPAASSPAATSPAATSPAAGMQSPGLWHQYYASAKKPGYSGVAIWSQSEPLDVRPMGIDIFDDEGRVLIADYPRFTLISAYFPNSQEAGARLGYKLEFCAAMKEICDRIVESGKNLILCGDYNIAHRPIDLATPKSNEQNPGYLPEERAWMDSFIEAGYVDTFRYFHPDQTDAYSWWSYRMRAREKNIGWRIDYHCVNPAFAPQLEGAHIRADVTGSDHCPVEITLKDGSQP